MKRNVTITVDSQRYRMPCRCDAGHASACVCDEEFRSYCTPVRFVFTEDGTNSREELVDIKQRKGEAELAQIDWLVNNFRPEDRCVLSFVTSSDVDAIPLHLYALSQRQNRPRDHNGKFKCKVLVWLRNPGCVYDITAWIEALESKYDDEPHIGMKVALGISIGGNDFIPKYYDYGHDKVLTHFLGNKLYISKLFAC